MRPPSLALLPLPCTRPAAPPALPPFFPGTPGVPAAGRAAAPRLGRMGYLHGCMRDTVHAPRGPT